MRKAVADPVAAGKLSLAAGSPVDEPVKVVCVALALALVVLFARIASIW